MAVFDNVKDADEFYNTYINTDWTLLYTSSIVVPYKEEFLSCIMVVFIKEEAK